MALFPKGFGSDDGGLLSSLTGGNPNAWLGYLAGALQGGTLGESIGRGIGGYAAGSAADTTAKGQRAALQYVAGQDGLPADLRALFIKDPRLAAEYAKGLAKPPEFTNFDGVYGLKHGAFPGGFRQAGAIPKTVAREPHQSLYEETPRAVPVGGAPGIPGARLLQQGGPKPDDIAGLRREAVGIPSIKRFQEAAPIYNSMVKSFGSNSRASDLDFVYGMAKIFDPDSVVREGEMVIVNKAQSLPSSIIGAINRINGGENLQPETRQELLKVSKTRMDQYEDQARGDTDRYRGIAQRGKMNPADVVPAMTPLAPLPEFRKAAAPADRPFLPQITTPAQAGSTFDQRFRGDPVAPALKPGQRPPAPAPKDASRPPLAPPMEAVNLLKSNPKLSEQFDAMYGPGMAARILGMK